MKNPELPSEEELLAGRMKDGSSPPLHSGHLHEHWNKPLPGIDDNKSAADLSAEELHYKIDMILLDDLDKARNYCLKVLDWANDVVDGNCPTRRSEEPPQEREEKQSDNPACQRRGSRPEADSNQTANTKAQDHPPAEASAKAEASTKSEAQDKPSGTIHNLPEPRLRGLPGPRPLGPTKAQGGPGTVVPPKPQDQPEEAYQRAMREAERMQQIVDSVTETGDHARGGKEKGSGSGTVPDPFSGDGHETVSGTLREPDTVSRNQLIQIKPEQVLALGERCARLLVTLSEKRAEVAHKLVEQSKAVDIKTSFMWNRAHGVVAATLLHMDETFDALGFGAYMPFRFPDQWLMFCGVMQRVLAANGLIHSKNADVYRRLLEETPPVEWPEGMETVQERVKKLKTPENWSRCWINRGARTMDELKERLEKEVWNKSPP